VEYIDIGGPTMVRAAAKNFAWVGVVADPDDYASVLAELTDHHGLSMETRQRLAAKIFKFTSRYETAIAQYFAARSSTATQSVPQFELDQPVELRYGENPHQKAYAYSFSDRKTGLLSAEQHQGKPLSFNNLLDADAAYQCVGEFAEPACVIVKHANPCGAAVADSIETAYEKAYQADPLSAFGGIVALNRPCTKAIAEAITRIFMEVVIAPSFSDEAKAIFAAKPNLRILAMPIQNDSNYEMRYITGAMLMQERDKQVVTADNLMCVTQRRPSTDELASMLFAWRVVKHIKSNAILIAKDNKTVGVGAGQVSRVDAVELALRKAGNQLKETVLASDAFFPFRDSIDKLAGTGVTAIIQPGGSVRDEEVIAACNENGITMMFTGKRCFRH
jgi:phosphoribosylaminoimidazolecarboxamide formyltransferase/IMP cyclohydrolase